MAFTFDVSTALNAIATLEDAIATPTPGVTNAYTYGNNPVEITDPSALPAVVHINKGPFTPGEGGRPAQLSFGSFQLGYDIESLLFILEVIPDGYPSDESNSAEWWLQIAKVFMNSTNEASLISSASAYNYVCLFLDQPSFGVRPWPPPPAVPLHWYWSLSYTHRFLFTDG
jgi:hypothetical protein